MMGPLMRVALFGVVIFAFVAIQENDFTGDASNEVDAAVVAEPAPPKIPKARLDPKFQKAIEVCGEDPWMKRSVINLLLKNGNSDPVQAELLREKFSRLDAEIDGWEDDLRRLISEPVRTGDLKKAARGLRELRRKGAPAKIVRQAESKLPTGPDVDGLDWVYVPAGKYWIGTPGDQRDVPHDQVRREVVQYEVKVGFFISTCEVTQEVYERYLGIATEDTISGRCSFEDDDNATLQGDIVGKDDEEEGNILVVEDGGDSEEPWSLPFTDVVMLPPWTDPDVKFVGDDYPAHSVNYDEAVAICSELSEKHSGHTFKLPLETEWEVAANGLIRSKGDLHPFSVQEKDVAKFGKDQSHLMEQYGRFGENSGRDLHLVGGCRANAIGLYDTIGNVMEWCEVDVDEYGLTKDRNFTNQVTKGGSYLGNFQSACCSSRTWNRYDLKKASFGFRVICRPND